MTTIVAMSDSHGRHLEVDVPDGDVLIHAGDFCRWGSRANVHEFGEWFSAFPHEYKIAIAGNHDIALQKYPGYGHQLRNYEIEYLEDMWIEVDGLIIHGSPWTLPFQTWAFMLPEEEIIKKFSRIHPETNILVTHGGPAGIMDLTDLEGVHAGSQALFNWVEKRSGLGSDPDNYRPLVHIFGHIHERHGSWHAGTYRAFNVSICDFKYNVTWEPTVIEI